MGQAEELVYPSAVCSDTKNDKVTMFYPKLWGDCRGYIMGQLNIQYTNYRDKPRMGAKIGESREFSGNCPVITRYLETKYQC